MRPSRLAGMTGIGVDKMGNLADQTGGEDILRLENLDTDLMPHPAVLAATQAAILEDRNNSYLPFVGQTRLRRAAAAHVSRLSGHPYEGDRNVVISAGGLSGILNVLLALIEPGDEVILTDPTYVGLLNRVRIAGGVPRLVPFLQQGQDWKLDREAVSRAVSPKTRAMLLMSPSMPSGGFFDREDWEEIARVARQHDLWLIYDTAMERILYDGRTIFHPANLPGMAERTITVGAASKELRMIGWRVGWIVAPETVIPDIALVSMSNVVVPVGIAQEAAALGLEMGDADVLQAVATWEQRRNLILSELEGLPVMRPAGGWSLLIDGQPLGLSGAEMSKRLFEKGRIAATTMDGWGEINGSRFVRFVFSNEPLERLQGIGAKVRATLL
ncbi:MAG: pyridoxal phosphate-dependent aminotransferase [Chloroflexi bacterium]|nr:pyridoxal phosphate-dependent aminotransferase [Chloroflexota bacterium]OJV88995.1 MAG: aspartate aminotransferase [Chloroflexi bacterium 54-19]